MKMKMRLFPKEVKIQTTASRLCGYLGYNSTTRLSIPGMVINNTTKTYSDLATDGTHIWIRCNNASSCKYNGVNATYTKAANVFMITIPDDYDPNIPFVFS